jgi:uncharacterized damage-inducible protein DinB
MITPQYVRTMASYNRAMNRRLYDAAARLPDADRKQDRGAFWSSIHGTFNHLLWADSMWMSRFAGWPKPQLGLKQSADLVPDFAALREQRQAADQDLCAWAEQVRGDWLSGSLSWFSGSAGRDLSAPRAAMVLHMFNHQTHHRGQVHAMLTAAGQQTGDTDIWLVVRQS